LCQFYKASFKLVAEQNKIMRPRSSELGVPLSQRNDSDRPTDNDKLGMN